jgi:hypothetical protein
VVLALAEIDRPESRDRLLDVARRGELQIRPYAVRGLADLGDPRLPDLLLELINHRSSDVREAAIDAALDFGDERILPTLRRLAERARWPGTRESALDAIEAIGTRTGREDVPREQRRLVDVPCPQPGAATITVAAVHAGRFSDVLAGDDLAELVIGGQSHWIAAPVDGQVVTARVRVGHPPPPVLFRLRPSIRAH